MSKHFPNKMTALAPVDHAPRGLTVRSSAAPMHMHLLLHNGCGRGNMKAVLSNEEAIRLAIEILKVATR